MVFVNSGSYGYVTESAALLLCVCYIYQRKAVPYTPTALFTSNIKLAEWFNPSQSIKLHHCWLVKDLESYLPLLILKRSKAFTSTQEIKIKKGKDNAIRAGCHCAADRLKKSCTSRNNKNPGLRLNFSQR